jgi:hypothetical protein
LKTNVIALEPKHMVTRFRSSSIDVGSLSPHDDRREQSSLRRPWESVLPDSVDMLVEIKMCRKLTGLSGREIILGVDPSPRHRATLRGYIRLCHGNARKIQEVLVHDLRSYLEIGARHFAADQLIVLRLFLADQLKEASTAPVTVLEARTREARERDESSQGH